jgi:hypothetical protein
MYMKKRCITCNKSFDLEAFNINGRAKDGHQSSCRVCTRGYDANRLKDPVKQQEGRDRATAHYNANREKHRIDVANYQMKQKLKAIEILGGECQRCGETHPAALQFHHRDPDTKVFNVTTKVLAMPRKWPWNAIEDEVAKCDLLCSNCHAKHHSVWIDVDGEWTLALDRHEDHR